MDFKPVYLREKKSVKPVKMEGKAMKAKRLLVLAVGAMLVMNVSAREVRKGGEVNEHRTRIIKRTP